MLAKKKKKQNKNVKTEKKENLCLIEIEQTWKMSTQNRTYVHSQHTDDIKMISKKKHRTRKCLPISEKMKQKKNSD